MWFSMKEQIHYTYELLRSYMATLFAQRSKGYSLYIPYLLLHIITLPQHKQLTTLGMTVVKQSEPASARYLAWYHFHKYYDYISKQQTSALRGSSSSSWATSLLHRSRTKKAIISVRSPGVEQHLLRDAIFERFLLATKQLQVDVA